MSTISFAITAWNEHVELERLLDQLVTIIEPGDEIMLQLDTTATPEVKKVADKYNVGQKFTSRSGMTGCQPSVRRISDESA